MNEKLTTVAGNRRDRIEIANRALATFTRDVQLYEGGFGLRMCWGNGAGTYRHDFAARLRSDGSWTMYGYGQRPTGGTGMQALAQLIRYVRDLDRLPMSTWKYWGSETVKLCTSEVVEILRLGNYGDPEKTHCVLCGRNDWKRGLDWWSLNGVTGPSCRNGACTPNYEAVTRVASLHNADDDAPAVPVAVKGGERL